MEVWYSVCVVRNISIHASSDTRNTRNKFSGKFESDLEPENIKSFRFLVEKPNKRDITTKISTITFNAKDRMCTICSQVK